MQVQKVIEMLGYSAKEAKVYLAMLSLGESHISDISDKVGMPRSSTQAIADKLHRDGLANFYTMRRYKYWVAENPRRLLDIVRERERAVEDELPHLIALRNEHRGKRYAKGGGGIVAYKVLADAIKQPVLVTNDKAQIEYANRAWEKQFGYTLREVKGNNPRMFQSGKTPKDVYVEGWKQLKKGKMYHTDKVVDRKKDGTDFPLETTVLSIENDNKIFYMQILDPR